MDGHLPTRRWSHINPWMVTDHPIGRKYTTDSEFGTHKNKDQGTTLMKGHLSSLEWSPTDPRMVIHQLTRIKYTTDLEFST